MWVGDARTTLRSFPNYVSNGGVCMKLKSRNYIGKIKTSGSLYSYKYYNYSNRKHGKNFLWDTIENWPQQRFVQ